MARLRNTLLVLLAGAMLMGVAVVDGRPAVFTDTAFYYAQGESAASLMGLSPRPDPAGARDPSSVVENDRRPAPTELDTYVGARSPFYGLLLYGATRAGSLWLLAALQSLAAALVLFVAARAMAPTRPRLAYAASIAVLIAATPLPFLTTFAMPEVFAGLALLSAVLLIAAPERLGAASRALLWATLAFGLICHGVYPPMTLAVLLASVVMLWRMGLGPAAIARRVAGVAAALALALVAGWTWSAGHAAATGHAQHKPPFLTARVLADGPGRDWLREACRDPGRYALCRFQDRDLADTEAFLWADDPRIGVFTPSDARTRLAIERQEPDFVTHVVMTHPLSEAAAATANAARQLTMVYVDDPLRDPAAFSLSPFFARTRMNEIIPRDVLCPARLYGCAPPLARLYGALRALHQAVALAALAFILWRLAPRGRGERTDADLALVAGLIIAAIFANAVICGVVSGPFPRYGARLVWLLPWLAVMLAARLEGAPARAGEALAQGA